MIKNHHIIVFLILINSMTLPGQNIDLSGGLNSNKFHDFLVRESSYNSDFGYTIRIGMENIKVDWLTLRLTLSYDKYGGELNASEFTVGSGHSTVAKIDKSVVSFTVFPINFNIIDRIDLNFGFEVAGLVYEKFKGTYEYWAMGNPYIYHSYDLHDKYDSYNAKTYFGLRGRLAYNVKIADNLSILPQYA
ncbi:MAG: hypothetical protein PF590_01465, partial [Candidatus Delongbacteria bacterium]|nr:hypothetical protein [Candidatus Delongbacteria bacterium]